uniref:ATP synthase subunit delta, chloroplastic n=2 Tax=Kappaphycus TaxID=38543 RepID=A0A2H4FGC9_9FLOR|nr:ATP synthase delta subunit [Kappaphycus striatus]
MSNQNVIAKVVLPYAEALLEHSYQNNLSDEVSQNLSIISDTLEQSSDLRLFFNNPLVSVELKKNVINHLFADQINTFVLKFLLVLVDRRRITLLTLIITKYFDLVYKLNSTAIAYVSTAIALTEKQQEVLIQKIKTMTNSKQVKLEMSIDLSLIGGFTIQIGSKKIDTSLSGKLKQMALYLSTK